MILTFHRWLGHLPQLQRRPLKFLHHQRQRLRLFQPNTTFVTVKNLYCQGSHGISVGSLGQYAGVEDIVSGILVQNVTMISAENGARIKAWVVRLLLHLPLAAATATFAT